MRLFVSAYLYALKFVFFELLWVYNVPSRFKSEFPSSKCGSHTTMIQKVMEGLGSCFIICIGRT